MSLSGQLAQALYLKFSNYEVHEFIKQNETIVPKKCKSFKIVYGGSGT